MKTRVVIFQDKRLIARYEILINKNKYDTNGWKSEIKNKIPSEFEASKIIAINIVTDSHPFDVAITLASQGNFLGARKKQRQQAVTIGAVTKGSGKKGRTMAAVRRAAKKKVVVHA